MHPIFMDLSQWEPFGISLSNPMSKAMVIAVLLVVGFVVGNLWERISKKTALDEAKPSKKWFTDWRCIVLAMAAAIVALGFVWVVGRVFTYGLMVACGFIFGGLYARRRFIKAELNPTVLNTLVMISLICGIVGARITYIIYNFNEFTSPYLNGIYRSPAARFIEMFKISQGGLVFDGGMTLGVIAILVYLWRKKLPIRRIFDIMCISLMIGLGFGRVGCFFNGCCYGEVCSEDSCMAVHYPYSGEPVIYPHDESKKNPWPDSSSPSLVYSHHFVREKDLSVPPEILHKTPDGSVRLKMPAELHESHEIEVARHTHSLAVYPVQLFAVVNAAVISLLLAMLLRAKHKDGQIFTLMLVFYGLTRFILELIRDDNPDMVITTAQYKCMAMMLAGVVGFVIFSLRRPEQINDTAITG